MNQFDVFYELPDVPAQEPFMEFDLTTWAGIAAAVTTIVSLGKTIKPVLFVGFERWWNLGLGLVLASVSKLAGWGFAELEWVGLIMAGLSSGIGASVIYAHGTKALKSGVGMKGTKPKPVPQITR